MQPAVLYVSHQFLLTDDDQELDVSGTLLSTRTDQLTFRLNYLTVPFKLVYSLKANGQGLQGFVGSYLSRFLRGHMDYVYSLAMPGYRNDLAGRREVVPGNNPANDDKERFGPWDAGLQAGLGYRYANVLVQATYNASLVNGGSGWAVNASYYPNQFTTSLTYFFGKTTKEAERSREPFMPAKLPTPRYSP